MKTQNELAHIDINTVMTTGAKGAVKAHGRIHEILDALLKGDCQRATELARKASALSAASGQIAVDAAITKANDWQKYRGIKRAYKQTR